MFMLHCEYSRVANYTLGKANQLVDGLLRAGSSRTVLERYGRDSSTGSDNEFDDGVDSALCNLNDCMNTYSCMPPRLAISLDSISELCPSACSVPVLAVFVAPFRLDDLPHK